jgi:hypothetical protein
VLAACGTVQVQPPAQTAAIQPRQQPAPVALPSNPPVPLPARKPAPPPAAAAPSSEPGSQALAMGGPEAVGPAVGSAVATAPQARDLIGLDEPAATRLLGEATEQSDQPPARIWRYKTATCELDLYFYLDLRSGRMRTLHYVFKGDTTDTGKRQNCLRDLVAARNS